MASLTQIEEYISRVTSRRDVVFRGQHRDYGGLIPRFYRGGKVPNLPELADSLVRLYRHASSIDFKQAMMDDYFTSVLQYTDDIDEINRATAYILWLASGGDCSRLADTDDYEYFTFDRRYGEHGVRLALLQHYGAPTPAIDVSLDPYVALWFALNEYVAIDRSSGYYLPSDHDGIVYLLRQEHDTIIDLTRPLDVPIAGLRAFRQKAALLLPEPKSLIDFRDRVVDRIAISPLIRTNVPNQLQPLSQAYLFPGPSEDRLYKELLNMKNEQAEWARRFARWFIEYKIPPGSQAT